MKKRILFVDDEVLVLQGLQRMLRPMRGEWETVFVQTGAEALQRLSQGPFDVVVADMRMPGMNGAELLAQVLKSYPQTVRLVLSGHADRELVLKCVGSTHQYLSKPCQPEELKAAIRRAADLDQHLRDDSLRQLIARMDRLPSIPSLYVEILEKLQDPNTTLEDIGETVAQDPAMTAKILKLVNSAFFGLAHDISSPAQAVSYLGLETIKALVLSIHAFSEFSSAGLGAFSIQELWRHSQETAGLAKRIAVLENADSKIKDEAFVSGLLHDTGKLVLASNFPDQYDHLLCSIGPDILAQLAAEERTFGANHAEVGGYLLGLWGLPVPVVEAIALHHHPRHCAVSGFSPLTAVHVASALVNAAASEEPLAPDAQIDRQYLASLGLEHRLETWTAAATPVSEPQRIQP